MKQDEALTSDSASASAATARARLESSDQTRHPGAAVAAPGASDNSSTARDLASQPQHQSGKPGGGNDTSEPPGGASGARMIGLYRLLQTIGEGGMGTIYKAEQRQPIRRIVALKLVKLGMDTKAVLARFEAERQALSLMDHPNIAKALDAGATETGRPYFVMEYVAGVPITDYCNKKNLPTRDRLELFMQVCDAVQHAHHKGVIHRDLKPSNVLVAEHDGKPTPKVIDFGVAKATHGRLTDATLATEVGGVLGTLGYMSPEQAELSGLDVDSRTDVYSLGVLLYELLVGEPPFDPKVLHRAAFTEAQRIIREQDPPRPSARLTTRLSDGADRDVARQLGSDLEKRVQALRGELDWIPLKALRKDRDERYATPTDMSQDVRRYLAGEPIEAHPPSATYRARKFLRRYRGPAAAVAIVLVTLVLGIAGTTWFAFAARQQANRASEAEAIALTRQQEAESERHEADRQRRTAVETNDFLVWMFQRADPTATQGQEITAAELVSRSVAHLEERFDEQPQVKTALQYTLGQALSNLGRPAEAEPLLRQAVDGRWELLGPEDPLTLESARTLAFVLARMGNPEAESLQRQVWKSRERVLGNDHPDTIGAMNDTGVTLMMLGRFSEAEPVFREMAARAQRVLPVDHTHRVGAQMNLGMALQSQGRAKDAEELLRTTLDEFERKLGPDHQHTLNCRTSLARALIDQKRYDEALPLSESALSGLRRRLGTNHPFTRDAAVTMLRLYEETGRPEEAAKLRETFKLPAAASP